MTPIRHPHEPSQLDMLTALDETEGLAPWFETDFRTPPITTEALAKRARCSVQEMARLLGEEERNGRVKRVGESWQATAELLAELGNAFGEMAAWLDEAAA